MSGHLAVLEELITRFHDEANSDETRAGYETDEAVTLRYAASQLDAAIALMRGQSDADKVLRTVWSILGPLPAPICVGCATEQTMALEAMRDYFGSNDYPAPPKDTADEQ